MEQAIDSLVKDLGGGAVVKEQVQEKELTTMKGTSNGISS
jgi:hypothetical protein